MLKKVIKPQSFIACLIGLLSLVLAGAAGNGCEIVEDGEMELIEKPGFRGIVGGTTTGYTEWKGAVGLRIPQGGWSYSICTGTLIDPEVVISAGHCVYYPSDGLDAVANPGNLTIVGGAQMGITYSKASEVVKHPNWNGNINNMTNVDLSMIKLVNPITTIETYPVTSQAAAKGTTGKIVGYGLTSSSATASSGTHRVGDSTILRLQGTRVFEIGNPAGTCQGDSGGPFFAQQNGAWVLAGVTSFGTSWTCNANSGSYDVNIYTYRSWIDEIMQQFTGHGLDDSGGDSDSDSDSDSDNDADSDSDNDADGDSDGDSDNDADGDSDGDSDNDADGDSDNDADGDGDGEGDGEGDEDTSDDGYPAEPFGLSEDNPVDCQCRASGRSYTSTLFNAFSSIF